MRTTLLRTHKPDGATAYSSGRKPTIVFHTQTSTEYWQKRGCLAHTDRRGNAIEVPDRVRIYVIASAQHNSPFGSEPDKEDTQQFVNPLPPGDVLRALIVALDLWVTHGVLPPPSQYPTVHGRTLVKADRIETGVPKIRGIRYGGLHNPSCFWITGRISTAAASIFILLSTSRKAST